MCIRDRTIRSGQRRTKSADRMDRNPASTTRSCLLYTSRPSPGRGFSDFCRRRASTRCHSRWWNRTAPPALCGRRTPDWRLWSGGRSFRHPGRPGTREWGQEPPPGLSLIHISGQGEGPLHRVHRRDRRHRPEAEFRRLWRKRRAGADPEPAADRDGRDVYKRQPK